MAKTTKQVTMHFNCLKCMVRAFLPVYLMGSGFIFHHCFACFMRIPHFSLDLEPLEHYFNSSITFQLEQPFNSSSKPLEQE